MINNNSLALYPLKEPNVWLITVSLNVWTALAYGIGRYIALLEWKIS